jgi:hypothetical protein
VTEYFLSSTSPQIVLLTSALQALSSDQAHLAQVSAQEMAGAKQEKAGQLTGLSKSLIG